MRKYKKFFQSVFLSFFELGLKSGPGALKSTTAEPFINRGISPFNRDFRQNLTPKGFLKVRHLHGQLQKDRIGEP